RIVKKNRKKQKGPWVSKPQQEYNQYIIVATSLAERISASRVLEIYRMRWQIELAFKRLKTLFQYGQVPVKREESCYAWFYGKLLLAALCETLVNEGRFSPSTGRKEEESGSP
ncbi:MAG: transposase, partial [Spirochaetales bacterium]|nr:transposase [Spirochaetales bacterium]